MLNKTIQLLIYIFILLSSTSAQTSSEIVRNELYSINKVFDSARFLAFDVDIIYSTDTILGKYETDHQSATYILDGKNIYYKVGGMEFMQNDSFTITTNEEEQMMVVTRQMLSSKSKLFPLNEFVDTVLQYFSDRYAVTVSGSDTIKSIQFVGSGDELPFDEIHIEYFPATKFLNSLQIVYKQQAEFDGLIDSSASAEPPLIHKKMVMNFNNYRYINDRNVFEDDRYIYFDRLRKAYVATGKYTTYRLIGTNLETSQVEHDDIESPALAEEGDK